MSSGKRIPHFSTLNRRELLAGAAAVSATAMLAPGALAQQFPTAKVNTTGLAVTDTEVTVGILHSVTGTMAISETGSVEAEKLAIDQINAMGGILGRKIEFIQEDGASDWPTFAEKSKKLRSLRYLVVGPRHRVKRYCRYSNTTTVCCITRLFMKGSSNRRMCFTP